MIPVGCVVWGLGSLSVVEQIEWYRKQGLRAVGFHSTPTLAPHRGIDLGKLDRAGMTRLEAALDGLDGIEIHAPFDNNFDILLTSPNPHIRAGSLNCLSEHLTFARLLGADVLCVHSGMSRASPSREARREALADSLVKLDAMAVAAEIEVAVEVADHFIYAAEFDLLDELALERVGICLDVGHIQTEVAGQPGYAPHGSIPGCVAAWGPRLKHVHLHDRNAVGENHLPLGAGETDLDAILASLLANDYQGFINLELNAEHLPAEEWPAQVAQTIERLAALEANP